MKMSNLWGQVVWNVNKTPYFLTTKRIINVRISVVFTPFELLFIDKKNNL